MPRKGGQGTQMLAQWTVQLIREAGLSARAEAALLLSQGLCMEDLAATGATIEHDAACALWERLAPEEPPDFGVRFSARFDIRGFGLVGYLAAASRSIGDMLTRVVRFHDLVKRPPTAFLSRRPGGFAIVETLPPGVRPWPRPLTESILGAYLSVSRKLTGVPIAAAEVRFQHGRPARPRDVNRFFGCTVEYLAPVNELVLPTETWNLPIASEDPVLLQFLEALAGQRTQRDDLDRLRTHVAQALSAGRRLTLSEAARELGMGPRTLQRRLQSERNLTFRGLVDEVRKETAERLISDGRLTLEEVCYLLGFSDPSALRKARHRWREKLSRTDRSLT